MATAPNVTPFRPSPLAIQSAKELQFDPPLDSGIRAIVIAPVEGGVETFESCEGGHGHSYPEPTVRFEGDSSEGLRALAVALAHGLPVKELRRSWGILEKMVHGPWWEMTFYPPKDSPQWSERNTIQRYKAEKSARDLGSRAGSEATE